MLVKKKINMYRKRKRATAEVTDKSCRYEYQLKFNYMENAAKVTTPFRLSDLPKQKKKRKLVEQRIETAVRVFSEC